jgi:hypothetical protein
MAFSDEIQELTARRGALAAETDATLTRLTSALYARLRPIAALAWMTDDGLLQAARAFADSAIRTVPAPPPASPPPTAEPPPTAVPPPVP